MWQRLTLRIRQDLLAHDPSDLNWLTGIRNALGIVIPLAVGVMIHDLILGIVVAVGAIVVGFAGLTGTWQKRMRVMIWAIIWLSLASFTGTLTGLVFWATVLLIAVSGGLAGISVASSPDLAFIGTSATNGLIIFSGLALNPKGAWELGLEVMAGGALQLLLMLIFVPWQPQSDGSRSLRQVFWTLKDYTERPTRNADLRVARAFVQAEERLGDTAIPLAKREQLAWLLRNLDSARNDIITLHTLNTLSQNPSSALQTILSKSSTLIEELGHQVSLGRVLTGDPAQGQAILALLPAHPNNDIDDRLVQRTHHLVQTLERISTPTPEDVVAALSPGAFALPSPGRFFNDVRQNLHWESAAFRHALRIMGTLIAALLVAHVLHLARAYWVPLTANVVLKADFFSTINRGLARVLGTAIGVIIGTLVVLASHTATLWGLCAIVVFGFGLYAVLNFNYTVFSVTLSAEIVVLLSFFEKIPPFTAMQDRLVDTLVGSALALVAFTVFPTWQRHNVRNILAEVIESERKYLIAIRSHDGSARIARRATRIVRTNAAQSINAALSEPTQLDIDHHTALALLDGIHTLAQALIAFEFYNPSHLQAPQSQWDVFFDDMDARLQRIEAQLKDTAHRSQPPSDEALMAPAQAPLGQNLAQSIQQLERALSLTT